MKRICAHLVGRVGLSRFLQWRFNTILIRWMPGIVVRPYLALMGRIYHFFKGEEKEEIRKNLRAILRRFSKSKSTDLIVRRTFRGIYHHYYEKLIIAYAHFGRVCRFLLERVELEGQHLIDQSLAQGRGVILVTGHFGAVEFLPLFLALKGYPVTMVVRFKTPRLKRALVERGASKGITLLDANNGEHVIFSALQALKSNEILITECDEFKAYRPHRNKSTQFLGCSCPLDRTLDLLRRRYSSPVIMGLVQRKGKDHYGLKLHSLTGIQQNFARESVSQRALQLLERYIYVFPEQWYQWKEVRTALGNNLFEETESINAAQEHSSLSPADRAVHAYQTLPS